MRMGQTDEESTLRPAAASALMGVEEEAVD